MVRMDLGAQGMAVDRGGGLRVPVGFALDNLGTGGTELNAVRLAERMDRSRFDLHLFALQAEGPLRDRFRAAGVTCHFLPIGNFWGVGAWRAGQRFRRLLREHQIRIFHAHDLYTSIFLVPWARTVSPRVATIASRRWWQPPSSRLGHLGRLTLPLADRLVVNSPALARRAVAQEGARPRQVVVIPNFLDEPTIRKPTVSESAAARQRLGVPPGAVVIGIVARLDPVKDHALLLQAFARVAGDFSEAHLLIVGDGPERLSLEATVADLKLSERVTFAGEQPNRQNLHVASDIAVLCSRHEGFPNSIIEAMGAARPVIATGVGGNVDAVRDGLTGLLFPVGDLNALVRSLERLLGDGAERHRMGCAAIAVARAEYGASSAMAQLTLLYDGLLSSDASEFKG